MRDRHFPRLCRSCQAPMARQKDACWRCGTQWAFEGGPQTALIVIRGGASQEARLDAERWFDDGGSVAQPAVAASG
jgi:predicted amidophosphoribosyltransferase